MRVMWLAKWKGSNSPLSSLSFSITLCWRLFWNSIVLKWTKMNIFSSWAIQSDTLIQKITDTNIFGKIGQWLHKETKVSVLLSSQSFRQKMITCDYKELTPFSSVSVLWISWWDVLIPSTSEPLYIGYRIIATVYGKIGCQCFITNVVFLDAKKKEV